MNAPTSRPREATDACPGVTRPFVAVDGSIVRLRPAAKPVAVSALSRLMEIVAGQRDPVIQLTSRAALQLRGLAAPLTPAIREAIRATGLAPTVSHELVRNVVASPLSGLDGRGLCDLRPLVGRLDAALCAEPMLARLPGRFLFVLDDGRGDLLGESFDLAVLATGQDRCVVLAGGCDRGWSVPLDAAVPRLIALAREFVDRTRNGESVWRVPELDSPLGAEATPVTVPTARPERPLGAVGDHAVVAVPLGLLRPQHVAALARVTDEVRVTPWRSLVIEHGARSLDRLEDAGLVTHADSSWQRLHACTGLPGCARSTVDTRAFARALAPALPARGLPVHVSGCERRCGTPSTAYVDVLGPASLQHALSVIRRADAASPGRVGAVARDEHVAAPKGAVERAHSALGVMKSAHSTGGGREGSWV